MKNWDTTKWFTVATIFAFLAFLSFFNIDSALSNEESWNHELRLAGVACLILSAVCLFKAQDTSNN